MSYYRVCPWCGAHLDPGELCDCKKAPPPVTQTPGAADDTMEIEITFIMGDKKGFVKR